MGDSVLDEPHALLYLLSGEVGPRHEGATELKQGVQYLLAPEHIGSDAFEAA